MFHTTKISLPTKGDDKIYSEAVKKWCDENLTDQYFYSLNVPQGIEYYIWYGQPIESEIIFSSLDDKNKFDAQWRKYVV